MDKLLSGAARERQEAEGCGAAEEPRAAFQVQKVGGGSGGKEEEEEEERGQRGQRQSDAEDAALPARLCPFGRRRRRRSRGGRKTEVAALEERPPDGPK